MKLKEYMKSFRTIEDAVMDLRGKGLPANYWLIQRWKAGKTKPSPLWLSQLKEKAGIDG